MGCGVWHSRAPSPEIMQDLTFERVSSMYVLMVDSPNKGPQYRLPKYDNPYCRKPPKVPLISGNAQI